MNKPFFAVGGVFAVFSFPHKRTAEMCHVSSDLMCSSGEELYFQKGYAFFVLKKSILCLD